ncbi:MAG: bifunctional nuclease family protein [Bernardetiaceae bacterium]|nr:bifunctional nuclease family protein [Bernardetiaceae bacterium]
MQKPEVFICALAESASRPGHYTVVLEDPAGQRRLAIILTHDLLAQTIERLGAKVEQVVITHVEGDAFFAQLHLSTAAQQRVEMEARPSDALALAVRVGCPVYVAAPVLQTAGYPVGTETRERRGSMSEYSLAELEELLAKLLAKEDYESASRVRDAIDKRQANL